MAACSCCAPRLGGKVAHLRRQIFYATLRPSPLKSQRTVLLVARPPLLGSLTGNDSIALRPKSGSVRRVCQTVPAAADGLESHGEQQAAGHPSEGQGPNTAGPAKNQGALQRVLATAATAANTYYTLVTTCAVVAGWAQRIFRRVDDWESRWPNPVNRDVQRSADLRLLAGPVILGLLVWCIESRTLIGRRAFTAAQALLYTFPIWKEQLRLHEVVFDHLLKHAVPPLYNHIAQAHGTTLAMLQLAVSDPERRLQQQLLKVVAKAYVTKPDVQHAVFQETAHFLNQNSASIVYGCFEGTNSIVDSRSAELGFSSWCSRERTTLRDSRIRLEQRKASRSRAVDDQEQLTVVTLLVAARGVGSAPEQITGPDIHKVLESLPSISQHNLISCQVLWTPVDKDTRYTSDDLVQDYPRMKAIRSRGSGVYVTHRRPGEEDS